MKFSAQTIPSDSDGEKDKWVESTYTSSTITTRLLPSKAASKEKGLSFQGMMKCLGKGIKARRTTWKEGELLWKEGNVLVHNTPYWGGEVINQYINGYPYVVKQGDVDANDWMICKEEGSGANRFVTRN